MRRWLSVLVVIMGVGCSDGTHGPGNESPVPPATSAQFDRGQVGVVAGRVRWTDAIPHVPPIDVERKLFDSSTITHTEHLNPHAPAVDPRTGGLAGAVVYLRGIDPARARPWDHPPVSIDVRDAGPIVRQGDAPPGLVGFVQQGGSITIRSKQPKFHNIRARGAAFFSLTLPEMDQPRTRVLNECGRVELSSAAGYIAVRGHLFVSDHPYYASTDASGRFSFAQVPPGQYDLVCWRPNWRIERQERDPETLIRVRLYYQQPLETSLPVTVRAGETTSAFIDVAGD